MDNFKLLTPFTPIHKICERCKHEFQCCVENISDCECSRIMISAKTRETIRKQFNDCLCFKCLREMAQQSDDE